MGDHYHCLENLKTSSTSSVDQSKVEHNIVIQIIPVETPSLYTVILRILRNIRLLFNFQGKFLTASICLQSHKILDKALFQEHTHYTLSSVGLFAQ